MMFEDSACGHFCSAFAVTAGLSGAAFDVFVHSLLCLPNPTNVLPTWHVVHLRNRDSGYRHHGSVTIGWDAGSAIGRNLSADGDSSEVEDSPSTDCGLFTETSLCLHENGDMRPQ